MCGCIQVVIEVELVFFEEEVFVYFVGQFGVGFVYFGFYQ